MNELQIKQSNYITNARYNFSEYEMKILMRIIGDIKNKLTKAEPEDQQVKLELNKTLFGDIEYRVTFHLSDIDPDNQKRVKKALMDLRQRSFSVEDDEKWFECGFINSAELIKATNKYQVRISPLLMPYMISTATGYSLYQLEAALKMNTYAKRLYMIFSAYASFGFTQITADKLRDNLSVTDGYKEYKTFKLRILNPAIKEINALEELGACDIRVTLAADSKKSLQNDWDRSLMFTIASPRYKAKELPEMTLSYNSYLKNILESVFKENLTVAKNIFNYMSGHKRVTDFCDRIRAVEDRAEQEGKPMLKYAGLVMNIAKEDYGYAPTKGKKIKEQNT